MLSKGSNVSIKEYLEYSKFSIEKIIRACYNFPRPIDIDDVLFSNVQSQLYIINDISQYMSLKSKESQFIDIRPTTNPITREIEYTILLHNLTITKVGKLYSLKSNDGDILQNLNYNDFVNSFSLRKDLQNYESLSLLEFDDEDRYFAFKQYLLRKQYFVIDETPEFKSSINTETLGISNTTKNTIFACDTNSGVCVMTDTSNYCPSDTLPFRLIKVFTIDLPFIESLFASSINPLFGAFIKPSNKEYSKELTSIYNDSLNREKTKSLHKYVNTSEIYNSDDIEYSEYTLNIIKKQF